MKITVPDYYKKFKCIAGACEDTCCAGWEVDVDEEKFRFYKTVGGELGERLKSVMLPKEKGEGCSFRLTKDKRCPFLNEKDLCDIITELGEGAICETCTNFPRFVHDYGAVREIGLAPSCFTAAQLMVGKEEKTALETSDEGIFSIVPNTIDPDAFFLLKDFREECFKILWNEEDSSHLPEKLLRVLERAKGVQDQLDKLLEREKNVCPVTGGDCDDTIAKWLVPFEGMEIINPDWLSLTERHEVFCSDNTTARKKKRVYEEFDKLCPKAEQAFTQLVFYFFFRYILEAVHDGRPMCAVKTGVVGYLIVRRLCVSYYYTEGVISDDDIADIFHLYSRQMEHSEVNFEHYRDAFDEAGEFCDAIIARELRA